MESRSIPQHKLSSECWMIQFRGKEACVTCDYRGTRECGGKKIVKTGKNEMGYKVPLN